MKSLSQLLKENFFLKKEIVSNRKQIQDLNNEYIKAQKDHKRFIDEGFNSSIATSLNLKTRTKKSKFVTSETDGQRMPNRNHSGLQTMKHSERPSLLKPLPGSEVRAISRGGAVRRQGTKQSDFENDALSMQEATPDLQEVLDEVETRFKHEEQNWRIEKQQMQETIINLSQEVDLLSSKNIEFLADMRSRDPMYESYRKTLDELNQLREAHGTLISMIKTDQIQVEESIGNETYTEMSEADGGTRGSRPGFGPNPYIENVSEFDLKMKESLNRHMKGRQSHRPTLQ